jgi:hypothetical protein
MIFACASFAFKQHLQYLTSVKWTLNRFYLLKVLKCENFHRTDFFYFFTMKPLWRQLRPRSVGTSRSCTALCRVDKSRCCSGSLWCRHVHVQQRLLYLRQVQMQLRPLLCKHLQKKGRPLQCRQVKGCSSGLCGVDTSMCRCSTAICSVDMSRSSTGLFIVDTSRCSSGPCSVDISRRNTQVSVCRHLQEPHRTPWCRHVLLLWVVMLLLSSLLLLFSVVTAAWVTGKESWACAKKFFSAGSACVGDFLAQAQPA